MILLLRISLANFKPIDQKSRQIGTGAKGGLFQIWRDNMSQLFSPLCLFVCLFGFRRPNLTTGLSGPTLLAHRDVLTHPIFLFFLGFRRLNLITGLSEWRTPD